MSALLVAAPLITLSEPGAGDTTGPLNVIQLGNSLIPGHSAAIRKLIAEQNTAAANPRPSRQVDPDAAR